MTLAGATKKVMCLLCPALFAVGCGRTPLLPPSCAIEIAPQSVDFGEVPPGAMAAKSIRVDNRGAHACELSGIGIATDSDVGFALSSETATSLVVPAGGTTLLGVTFRPERVSIPLVRAGSLVFVVASADASKQNVAVPLTARIQSNCSLEVSPSAVDLGWVTLGDSVTGTVSVVNQGAVPCEFGDLDLAAGSDAQFFLPRQGSGIVTLDPGQTALVWIGFAAIDANPPHHRTANLAFASTDPGRPDVVVPVSADIDVGCNLTWAPAQLDFGLVILNTETSATLTLGNDGTKTCFVSGLGLDPGGDPDFTLDASQARALSVAPDANVAVRILFRAADSSPPHWKTGALVMRTGNIRTPEARVPLSAYVSTVCIEASRWVYTVDVQGKFSRFDPSTLAFSDIGTLDCPSADTPNSMAVDQDAVAWVGYHDGNLFKVDTSTGKCEATGFVKDQHGLHVFGMGFMFDPSTGVDTLYLAGDADNSGNTPSVLATLSFPSLVVTPIGIFADGNAELGGTGDGELWGFIPSFANASSNKDSMLLHIDPSTGETIESFSYPSLATPISGYESWAMKFWGGSFWIFLNGSIYQVPRDTPETIKLVLTDTSRQIVGAGVSTCAPLR